MTRRLGPERSEFLSVSCDAKLGEHCPDGVPVGRAVVLDVEVDVVALLPGEVGEYFLFCWFPVIG